MGVSILDAHPNNECIDLEADEVWFSFIFCGSRIDRLNLHAYDYYTGDEVLTADNITVYEEVPALENKLGSRRGVGNGVRVNIKEFVKDTSVFSAEGEYTWRAELVQEDGAPDNMVYEGVLPGDPNFTTHIGNIKGLDLDHYLPLSDCIKNRIRPPYYVDFLDDRGVITAYDIPVTYDEVKTNSDGTQCTVIQVDTYTSVSGNTKSVVRPAIGTAVYVHKKKYYGATMMVKAWDDEIFIDERIPNISANNDDSAVVDGCYLKVGSEYYLIQAYDKDMGIVKCQNGNELKQFPAGTHYAIYTSRFWTPYYYFRVHNIPTLEVSAEFHERRRLQKAPYNTSLNCLENTCNGILFDARLSENSHAAVKYHCWDIIDAKSGRTVFKTEKIYSQEMECEAFVPFGHEYIGKITVVTQDGITLRGEAEYYLPASPAENDERFSLRAYQNRFGGVELAWDYNYWYDGGSLLKATDFEVFRVDKRLNKVKYLGKVDCSPIGIEGFSPAASGHNWWLIDKDCDFTLRTPVGAKINMYLVGGGCDGGSWDVAPNSLNQSFAVGQKGGEGGYFNKKSIICEGGVFEGHAKIAERNKPAGTVVKAGGVTYKCGGEGSQKRGKVSSNTMEQTSDYHVVYNDNAENGVDGFSTPYGIVGSSGGGGASCGGNKTSDVPKSVSVSGIVPKMDNKTWLLIDRDSLVDGAGEFELNVPNGAKVTMWLVGGGSDGSVWKADPKDKWDKGWSICYPGGGGGYVLEKEIEVAGTIKCSAVIADANDNEGTTITIGGNTYKCNDSGSTKTPNTSSASAAHGKYKDDYKPAGKAVLGVETPCGYVGSSGGGGGFDNMINPQYPSKGAEGAGDGGLIDKNNAYPGTKATNYGCGGGGGSAKEFDYNGHIKRSAAGKGMPGCIIFRIDDIEAVCPDPGRGGTGAGDGGFPDGNGDNAVNYGCGGGNAGFYAVDSYGNYKIGAAGRGMQGCVILEVDLNGLKGGAPEQVYAVDWTAASDKEYRYIVTGCNYESAYLGEETARTVRLLEHEDIRHEPEEMIECTAYVDITPHFNDFYLYFLNDADILRETEYDYENYDVPLTEPMGRYVTSRNNPYKAVRRHMNTLALERDSRAFYRRHTWRVEGDVEIGEVSHNITRNVSPIYARMPAVTAHPTDYDSFSVSFLFGYLDCCACDKNDFMFNDQYMFELWKKCVFEKKSLMIKDPKGNVWTGVISEHQYKVEYDTNGMPYIISFDFVQTRTEDNTLVMIVDDHNKYLKTAENNHLK